MISELPADQLCFGPAGVRAQAIGRGGAPVDHFELTVTETSVHVVNAPSPAVTASLAIAEHLVTEVDRAFALR